MTESPPLAPPRPLSAYVFVAVTGAVLAVTGQLSPVAIAAHALALGVAFALRRRPQRWQRNPLALNAGLALALVASAALWLHGARSLVALAHFAHFAQALQLLDARPRRSDFLLVALGLFQVILAANLTDSLLFPPLLVASLLCAVWTLLVHTLWTEALAAGEPWSTARRTVTPGLFRMTLGASAASLVLALGLFLLLPRLRSGPVLAGGGGGAAEATAGFTDRVTFDDLGRIRQDHRIVLRVETLRGTPPPRARAYWRGLAFDRFDGRTWSVTPARHMRVPGIAELGLRVSSSPVRTRDELVQRIVREPVVSGVLFGEGIPQRVRGDLRRVERDANGGLYAPATSNTRISYRIVTEPWPRDDAALRNDVATPPRIDGQRYLQLPPLSPAVTALARRITAGLTTDADRALAIATYLQRTGHYTDDPPQPPPGDPRSPIEAFLLGKTAGYCEYFASGMVVLAREIGIPARLVNGFAGGTRNPIGGFVELRRSDAHAWVEVHYAHAGWVPYDPTPPGRRLAPLPTAWSERVQEFASAAQLWWFQHVVEFDRSDQIRALRYGWRTWQHWRGRLRRIHRSATRGGDAWVRLRRLGPALLLGGAAAACALLGLAGLRGLRFSRRTPLPRAYAEALRLLARRGLVRERAAPARDFARRAATELPPAAAAAFWTLTEAYLAERFGQQRPASGAPSLRALRDSLRG